MSFLSRLFGGLGAPGHPVIQPVEYKTRFMDGKEAHTLIDVRTSGERASFVCCLPVVWSLARVFWC